jgi:hypothetical protein
MFGPTALVADGHPPLSRGEAAIRHVRAVPWGQASALAFNASNSTWLIEPAS